MSEESPRCLYCECDENEVPLVSLRYQGHSLWICSQHLPILIHKPQALAEKLPGADALQAAEHDH